MRFTLQKSRRSTPAQPAATAPIDSDMTPTSTVVTMTSGSGWSGTLDLGPRPRILIESPDEATGSLKLTRLALRLERPAVVSQEPHRFVCEAHAECDGTLSCAGLNAAPLYWNQSQKLSIVVNLLEQKLELAGPRVDDLGRVCALTYSFDDRAARLLHAWAHDLKTAASRAA